jgi:chemotaxis signal transduction protein
MISSQRACVVQFGQFTVGIAGAYTRQVYSLTDLRRAPRTASALLGLFALRSQVIPIVALEPLLELSIPKHEFAVQLEFEARNFGIGIDAALGFVVFEAVATTINPVLEPICYGGMRYAGGVIPMLSLPKVLEALSVVFAPQSSQVVFTAPINSNRVLS